MKKIPDFCVMLFSIFTLQSAYSANEVTTCDVTFMLPAHLKVTKPVRSINDDGVNECKVLILPIKNKNGECKDKDEGGRPPYKVCDWTLGEPEQSMIVARTNLRRDKKRVGDFYFEKGTWRISDEKSAEKINFSGKSALRADSSHGAYWFRAKHQNGESIFAGTIENVQILLQLTPTIAVVLNPAVADDDTGAGCKVFCSSLRAAKAVKK